MPDQATILPEEKEIIFLEAKDAKFLFKTLRAKGAIVDKGRSTGNIYNHDRSVKLISITKNFKNQWGLEILDKRFLELFRKYSNA